MQTPGHKDWRRARRSGRHDHALIARLLTIEGDCKSAEALRIKVAVETASPCLVTARNLLDRFRAMIAAQKPDDLDPWIAEAAE